MEAGTRAIAPAGDDPLFHPLSYGSPYEAPASAGFFGLRSWHDRADMLRAVIEGAVVQSSLPRAGALASAFNNRAANHRRRRLPSRAWRSSSPTRSAAG